MSVTTIPQPAPSRITVPPSAHPLVQLLFREMQRQGITYEVLEARSGIARSAVRQWRRACTPTLIALEACLGVVGIVLVPQPK